ncbi:hypothetical protein L2E82_28698 [Cichorium intybus]|uniref:Uncharacterized protein n=1 Tax=Cichorium intybus TaxID=13427 RepID=A0ACB9CWH2_CICIN|nr:hypothetical protein L2E82_28698 [Cichorium intybus]
MPGVSQGMISGSDSIILANDGVMMDHQHQDPQFSAQKVNGSKQSFKTSDKLKEKNMQKPQRIFKKPSDKITVLKEYMDQCLHERKDCISRKRTSLVGDGSAAATALLSSENDAKMVNDGGSSKDSDGEDEDEMLEDGQFSDDSDGEDEEAAGDVLVENGGLCSPPVAVSAGGTVPSPTVDYTFASKNDGDTGSYSGDCMRDDDSQKMGDIPV